MERALRFLLATTIVAVIQAHSAVAQTFSEDVAVPGGTAAVAAALGIDPVPDRARFVSEIVRLVYGPTDRKPLSPAAVALQVRELSTLPSGERVPVPLTAAVWSRAVFKRPVAPDDLVFAILSDRQAAFLCHGLAGLDDETLQYLADHPQILTEIYLFAAEPFAVFSSNVRVRNGRVVTPGGDEAASLWEAVTRQGVARPDRFVPALFTQGAGKLAYLYDTIGHLDPPRQRFALKLWTPDKSARLASMQALAVASLASDWQSMKTQPFVRQAYDLAASLMRVSVDASGNPAGLSSRGFWSRALESPDLPDDPGRTLRTPGEDTPIDAAWLADLVTGGDIRLRAERLDQFAFGQRVFARVSPSELPDTLVAVRAFRRYRMLMVTFERLGLSDPALYARAARTAARLSLVDPLRAFVVNAQFQGAMALLWRMRASGTLGAAQTEKLVSGLLAVPLNGTSQYSGALLEWIAKDLRAVLPRADSLEASLRAAISGPPATATTTVQWEGRRYRFDVSAGEQRRLEKVRERQGGATLDVALNLAAAAERLGSVPLTPAVLEAMTGELRAVADDLAAQSGEADADGLPPGVLPPPDPLDTLRRAIGGLTGSPSPPQLRAAAAGLVEAADEIAAAVLVSLVYAMNLGDPDGAALLPGDVSKRHDFGLGQKDANQRMRAAWMMPRPDVSPGVPWHVDGSLLGLDIGMAGAALRRLNTEVGVQAPTLTSNDRETFAASFALVNPFALTDAARDAIADAIERGGGRVRRLRTPDEVTAVADELDLDGWRRRAVRWTVAQEPDRMESMFSLRELVSLGRDDRPIDLNPWGTAAMLSTGCVCTQMSAPARLPLLTGRRQIGLLATAVPDLNLHVARTLSALRLPAPLAKYVLSAAVLDFVNEVQATDTDDWLSLVRGAAAVPRERIEDYVAAAAADGPLLPDTGR